MTSVWKRLQRVNKRAAKFQFTASYHRVDLETTSKWKPNKLSVVWSRRSRRVVSDPLDWEPSMKEPLKGSVIWAVPDNHNIAVTLFRDQRTNELEDKDWIFILEDVASNGKRRRIAQVPVNLRPLATAGPSQKCLSLQMKPCTTKVTSASLEVTISSVLLREGSAADEDMQSMASMMSVNNNSDIAHLEDFDEEEHNLSDNLNLQQVMNLTQQVELMTSSLTGTPGSGTSVTPIAMTPSESMEYGQYKPEFIKCSTPISAESKHKEQFSIPIIMTQTTKPHLKPLELKSNLNDYRYSDEIDESHSDAATPIVDISLIRNDGSKPSLDIFATEKTKHTRNLSSDSMGKVATPANNLLEWCRDVTKDYPQCNITNFTTSWTDGIAFCAIINRFRPDLIDMTEVSPENSENNVRIALKASTTLGVPGVFLPSEIRRSRGPDRLALITYLHQLRALFTNQQFRLSKIGQTTEESSYVIGNFNTDKNSDISVELFSQEILSLRQKKNDNQSSTNRTSLSSQDSMDSQNSQDRSLIMDTLQNKNSNNLSQNEVNLHKDKSPIANVRDILTSSKNILGRVLSPTKEKIQSIRTSFDSNKVVNKDVNDNSSSKLYSINKEQLFKDNKKETVVKQGSNLKSEVKLDNKMKEEPEMQIMGSIVREARPVKLMTRRQLTDPFGSDEEDDNDLLTVQVDESKPKQLTYEINENLQESLNSNNAKQNPALTDQDKILDDLPKPTQQLLSRHDELKEKARQLLEAAKKEAREKESVRLNRTNANKVKHNGLISPQKISEDERQAQLRERAKKLISDARAGLIASPTSPVNRNGTVEILNASRVIAEHLGQEHQNVISGKSPSSSPEKYIESVKNNNSDTESNVTKHDGSGKNSPTHNYDNLIKKSGSPLHSLTNIMDRISPDKDSFIMKGFGKDMRDYIEKEMDALEREQSAIDEQAAILEKELREVMENSQSEEQENALMTQWFTLVNKKNALLRRQMQLNILEQENDLRVRHAKVDGELRALLKVEEWRKSEGQRGDEARLLSELLTLVEARDQLVHHLHEHEQAMEDDDEIERNLSHVELSRKNNCAIQ